VFSGRDVHYDESAPPDPVYPYGAAKAAAETAVRAIAPAAAVVRTSLIIGGRRGVHERLTHRLASGEADGVLFTDEIRTPVHVDDLADAVLELAGSGYPGILNVAGSDAVSRYDLGVLVARRDDLRGDRRRRFVARCATVPNPVLALELFSERGFRWANLAQLLYGTGFTIMFFGNVQFLREVWGYSPVWTGLAMAPGPLVVFLLAPPFGRLAGRIGQRPILIPGGVISAAAALFLLSRVDSAPAYLAVWLPFTLVSGVGVSMVLPLLTSAAVAGLPADRFATGSAVNAALRNLGQTLGVAIFVALAGRTTAGELLAHHRIAWWLVAAAGVAVSATSWRLPRVGATTRAVERDRHLILLRPTASRPSPIAPGEPATTRIRRVRQGVSS